MKRILIICMVALTPSFGGAEEQKPQEIIAACNVQIGQTMIGLGQTQQQVILLEAQVAELQRQLATAREGKVPEAKPSQN